MAVTVKEALDTISNLTTNLKYEIIPIEDCINRICAENIFAKICLPRFNNSAMDGYAILFEDANKELELIDTIFAGDNNNKLLKPNTCIKIMTGARIPDNCNVIIPKEDCTELENGKIKVPENIKMNQHIRFIGEDIDCNDLLIKEKEEINFSKITLLSSQGLSHIKVYKKPKIVVFASGEELKLHYEKAEDYQIYNSNTPTFISRCQELGCDVDFIGQAKDSIEAIKELILNSLGADLIITSGGVSVGDADFTRDAFKEVDCINIFEGIKIKPGKPTVFGKIKDTYILNLPGNPLASALIFELFGKLIIQKLLGSNLTYHNFIFSKLGEDLKNKKGRITIIPGNFDGRYFYCEKKSNPGMVSTLSKCNSLIVLDENVSLLKKDSEVKVLPISWKFFEKEYKDFLTNE
ncbi:molybdopterin molybdotransferase MoeA [Halarcobacter ebronensis]|uniref:Molybdopterin molybdenumtransferase n=1 Tax=Halarcobacter ebronensis TaxID=1462615 RepID=A0A4Q1AXY2_9BACT|nr:molybdopterin molybdotransferase MoeA [Halarcobacter ebronensis]QKF80958.1 molybdopterin molybdenumtransferase [Halarcobacter ebronensis]RXK06276.1 molybdopterin molybdenumtransferase MoeA [Halarcobacter ebronensis]